MKKFTSIVCALVIALSVNAAPFQSGKKHVVEAPFAKSVIAKKAGVFKAPLATREVEDMAVEYMEAMYYAQYGVYVYMLIDEVGDIFYFSFPCTDGVDPVVSGVTYTLADLNADYSYYDFYGMGMYYLDFAAVTFTKTVATDGNVVIEVYVKDSYGYEYNLTYDQSSIPEVPAGGTFEADDIEEAVWTDSCQYILYCGDSLTFYFAFDVENLVSGQTYTESNMVAEYTGIVFGYTILDASAITFVKTDAADGSYTITGTIVDENGNIWNITGTFTVETSDMTFTFASGEEGITITPSNTTDEWDWIIVNDSVFAQYGADYIATAIYGEYGNAYAAAGERLLAWSEDIANYTQGTAGTYYLIVWGAGEKNVTTPAVSYEFEIEDTQAIDNIDAKAAAIKRVVNGQLIIEKNGLKFNAQGIQVK